MNTEMLRAAVAAESVRAYSQGLEDAAKQCESRAHHIEAESRGKRGNSASWYDGAGDEVQRMAVVIRALKKP